MGGLGNGRRGGRSPPLLIAALIACILVLGFNYWVSSSRNLELQTKLYELEGQVRRGAAERGVAEMKKTEFQEEIQRQKEQISRIESVYKKQLEGAQNTCSQEKVILQQNISSSTKTIQELKGQLNQLNDDVGQLQKELQSCQGSIKTLNNKLTYDMTHCHAQVLSQKELCDERVAAAKLEAQKKIDKLMAASQVSVADPETPKAAADAQTPSPSQRKENQPQAELLSNDINENNAATVPQAPKQELSKQEPLASPTAAVTKLDLLPPPGGAEKPEPETGNPQEQNNAAEERDSRLTDAKDEAQTEDPGMEGMLLGKADESLPQKPDLQEEYEGEDQEAELDKEKKAIKQENIDPDMEDDPADYNGDDENEGEFEADKQAALTQT